MGLKLEEKMYKLSFKAFCMALCICLSPVLALTNSVDITSIEAAKMLKEPVENRVLLDVRTPKEYDAEHIQGSQMIDVQSDDFKNQVAKLDKNAPHIVFCRSGKRSAKAANIMEEMGFTNVKHMKDGIEGWKDNNLGMIVKK